MKTLISLLGLTLTSLSFAQGLPEYSGDYKLKLALSACNPIARVDIQGNTVSIVNPDLRDNRGWSTVALIPGEKRSGTQLRRVTITNTKINSEVFTYRNGSESGYTKDTYTFEKKINQKTLNISLSVETRGNVSGYGTTCIYEKI